MLLSTDSLGVFMYRAVLVSGSGYFRKRLEDWHDDPWTMTGADGKPLLVVGVEEELMEAAAGVLKLVYADRRPTRMSATQLAQVGLGHKQETIMKAT
jgi:hypothetical protein